nr:immunoglobulin light chain junction region [Macaca mulatta]
CQHGYDTPYSF